MEYGSSFEATRTLGLIRTLYDIVYDMNMAHLSADAETVFERLGDAGVRTACTPFLIYRGRRRHEVGLEGVLRRVAMAATFRHAVWGPDELFYGELYASRKVPCKPTLARPGTRDEYSGCVGRELAREGLYDFLLFSLPDNDHHSHKHGPEATDESIALADAALGELVDACGGIDRFLRRPRRDRRRRPLPDGRRPRAQPDRVARVPVAGPRPVGRGRPEPRARGQPERTRRIGLRPGGGRALPQPSTRASRRRPASARRRRPLRLARGRRRESARARPGGRRESGGGRGGDRAQRRRAAVPPGRRHRRPRGQGWDIDGDLGAIDATLDGTEVSSAAYPDALARVWAALNAPQAGEVVISLAAGLRVRRLGRRLACGRRQPRGAGRRGLAGPPARARARGLHPGRQAPVDDRRRERAGPRSLRPRRSGQ